LPTKEYDKVVLHDDQCFAKYTEAEMVAAMYQKPD
jgi:hypothetical protein